MKKTSRRPHRTHLFEVVVTYCPDTPGPYKYAVEVPALPGCFSDGRSEEEALENVKEAIVLWLGAHDELSRKKTHLVEVAL